MSEEDQDGSPPNVSEAPTELEIQGAEPCAPAVPLKLVLEAVLFSSQKPLSTKEIRAVLKGAAEGGDASAVAYAKTKDAALVEAFSELAADCEQESRTYELRETAAGWQLVTRAMYAPWLRQLYPENRTARISAPAMETLAIIAYRQPITRADIEAVRGVAVDGVMQTLLDRGLVRIAGRAEVPGRPLLYETTQFFMEHFGIKNLDELPNADELRRIELPKAQEPVPEPVVRENELPLGLSEESAQESEVPTPPADSENDPSEGLPTPPPNPADPIPGNPNEADSTPADPASRQELSSSPPTDQESQR